ncbi:hypothetical protein DL96DRAFT_1820796 [Flagelloscypha sp. PMI_526]|nr:hypothetical protein DL96DRAFT_1820796 [Flagelloscypha sp. PMI_526]
MASTSHPSTSKQNRTAPQPSLLKTTTFSAGTSSQVSFSENISRSEDGRSLKQDVKKTRYLSFKDFLSNIFAVDSSQEFIQGSSNSKTWTDVTNSPAVLEKLDMFRKTTGGETARYAPFISLANQILDETGHHTIRFCRNDNTMVAGSFTARTPDIVVVRADCLNDTRSVESCSKQGPKDPFWWHNILMCNEFEYKAVSISKDAKEVSLLEAHSSSSWKRKPSGKATLSSNKRQKTQPSRIAPTAKSRGFRTGRKNPDRSSLASQKHHLLQTSKAVQCAGYALELLAHSGLRNFVLGIYMINAEIRPIYYDRSIIIESDSVNILENTRDIVCLFDALASSNWGLSKFITSKITPQMPKDTRTPLANIFAGGSLSFSGYSFTLKNDMYIQHRIIGRGTRVFKVVVSTTPEKDTAKIGQEYCAKISWPAKNRNSEIELVKAARDVANSRQEWKDFLNNLPEIFIHADLDVTETQIRLAAFFSSDYKERIPRIIIMTLLFPIKHLERPHQLMKVFKDIFFCHRWLYDSVKILYRDLSEDNIMFRRIGDCVYGVLNDFDLSSDWSIEEPPTTNQRIGTAPFMAIDLLKRDPPPHHLYRHDLESLYYIIVSMVCDRQSPPVSQWFELDSDIMAAHKLSILLDKPLQPCEKFQIFTGLLSQLHSAFRRGLLAQIERDFDLKETYDDETLGGWVSFEKIAAIFNCAEVPKMEEEGFRKEFDTEEPPAPKLSQHGSGHFACTGEMTKSIVSEG